jgi:serine/threonine protein kinase
MHVIEQFSQASDSHVLSHVRFASGIAIFDQFPHSDLWEEHDETGMHNAASVDWTNTIETFTPKKWPPSLYNFLSMCLELDPSRRISSTEALMHKFFSEQFE